MLSDADIYYWLDGSEFMGERLVVQFARGSTRPRDGQEMQPRMAPRPRRTVHRMTITGLPFETSWQVSKVLVLVCKSTYSAFFGRCASAGSRDTFADPVHRTSRTLPVSLAWTLFIPRSTASAMSAAPAKGTSTFH